MSKTVFIDTGGFFAFLVAGDDRHEKAVKFFRAAAQSKTSFITTDYILDETVTLLRARGHAQTIDLFLDDLFASQACRIEWMDPDRFQTVRAFSRKHRDHPWSFTDCFSFIIMREAKLLEALSKDAHFKEAGFVPLLA